MPKIFEAASLAVVIFLLTIVRSIPAWMLVNTGNLSLLLVAVLWVNFSGIFASVFVLTNWVEDRAAKLTTTILKQTEEICGNCVKFRTKDCTLNAVDTDAPACPDFDRKEEEKEQNQRNR